MTEVPVLERVKEFYYYLLKLSKKDNMKFIRLKNANWMVAMALLALPGALTTSCSRDANQIENIEPTNGQLVISVQGIKNPTNGSLLKGSTAGSRARANTTIQKVYEFSDADLAVSVGNNVPVKSVNFSSKNRGSGLRADLPENAEALEDNAKYVLYIYETDDTFVKAVELTAGSAGTVDGLDGQSTYKWVALSYNSAAEGPTNLTGTDVVLPTGGKTDVLRASGTIDLSQESAIDILFEHVFSRIGIELTTIGVFGDITGTPQVGVTGLELASGSLNLLTGDLTPGDAFPAVLAYADFEPVNPAFGDQMIAYVYTAPVAAQNVSLTLQNLVISHADGNQERTFFASSPGSTQSISVIPEAGKSHHLKFDIVESALTNEGVRWGRSNLYWRGDNGGLRDYAFYHTNGARSTADGYFAYGGTKPLQFPTEATSGDPCALVYPAGLWMQPTDAQINTLTTESGLLSNVIGLIGGLLGAADPAPGSSVGNGYVQYASAASGSAAFPTESNSLRFYYNGQITNASLLSAVGTDGEGLLGLGLTGLNVDLAGNTLLDLGLTAGPGLSLPVLQLPILGDSYGEQAAFWSSTGALTIPILASVGSWGYSAYTTQQGIRLLPGTPLIPTGPEFVKATTTAELLSNVDLLGIDLLNTSLKNVRCVRAN